MKLTALWLTALSIMSALGGIATTSAVAAPGDITLISQSSSGVGGDDDSYVPVMTDDGNTVAFSSYADNLIGPSTPLQIYVRDVAAGTTTLASRNGPLGAVGNGDSDYPDIAASGRFVAFESQGTNFGPTDADGSSGTGRDVYMRDLQTGVTSLISSNPVGAAVGQSYGPSISADGRFVAFESSAAAIAGINGAGTSDIFIKDTQTGTFSTASQIGGVAANGSSYNPEISDNGRWVVYRSGADNLSTEDDNSVTNVFLFDTQTGSTTLVSRQSASAGGAGANGNSDEPAISANGRYVSFVSGAANLGANAFDQTFVRDLQTNTTTLVSTAGGTAADGDSDYRSELSDDGRYIAFNSAGNNLSSLDTDGSVNDTFVRDTVAGTTTLISRQSPAAGGLGANDGSAYYPDITGDGRWVSFDSEATNLSPLAVTPSDDGAFRSDYLGPPPDIDTTGPDLDARRKGKAKAGKALKIVVSSDEPATLAASATAKAGKKRVRFKGASGSVAAGGSITLKLKLAKRPAKLLKKAGKGKAKVVVTATDGSGNESTDQLTVKLK